MTEPDIYPVGHTFIDTDGEERITTQWGFNAFCAQEGAAAAALSLGRNGSTWYIWRLTDGSYEHTCVPDPDLPWYADAELVETFTVSGYGKRKKAVAL